MKAFWVAVCCACWLIACSTSGTSNAGNPGADPGLTPEPGPDTSRDPLGGPVVKNGQTGSMGGSNDECDVASDCEARARDELAVLEKPGRLSRTFIDSECVQAGVVAGDKSVSGTACECKIASTDGVLMIGPVGLGCYVLGRGGDCLWGDDEFDGCQVGADDACTDVCDELESRFADDAARTFDTRVVHTACDAAMCHAVVEIDGRCFADRSYQQGRSYDCALGGEAILQQHSEDIAPPPPKPEVPSSETVYQPGTDGFIELAVNTTFYGTAQMPAQFSVWAQFFVTRGEHVERGDVIDPLEGIDDCAVINREFDGGALDHLIDVADLTLSDDGTDFPVPATSNSQGGANPFYSYALDLTELGVEPRYGGSYAITGGGGGLGEAIAIGDLHLPDALSIHELESAARVERDALRLTWTGHGSAPLRAGFSIVTTLSDSSYEPYTIECLLADDGEFEIPKAVLEAAPEGFVIASFMRQARIQTKAGDKTIVSRGAVLANHRFALGARCERDDVMAACLRSAEKRRAEYEACGIEPPPTEELCPDYLSEACNGCTEYFDCLADHLTCRDGGLQSSIGCACP